MKKFKKLFWRAKLLCKHKSKKVVFEDYPERCTKYYCEDCKTFFYEGWD